MLAIAIFSGAFLLAQSELPDPKSSAVMGWLLAAVAGIALTGNQILGWILNIRKLRGNDPAADQRYATRTEHEGLQQQVNGIEVKLQQVSATLANELRSINRSLGRLEGALGTAPGIKNQKD